MAYNSDRTFTENFTEHPASRGMSYPVHMIYALSLAAEASIYVVAFIIHALFPFICSSTGSDGIKSMTKKFSSDEDRS